MKRLFCYLVFATCLGAGTYLLLNFFFPRLSGITVGEPPTWSDPPTAEEYRAQDYRWADCNRRIHDREYHAGAWYKTEDPNVTVYLDLIEQEEWNAPVLHYSASDPNATIYIIYQQLLADTSEGPIRWPKIKVRTRPNVINPSSPGERVKRL